MRIFFLIAATAVMVAATPSPGRATANLPVCATMVDRSYAGMRCDFATFEQCRQTVLAVGGSCSANPEYPSAAKPSRPTARTRR